MMRKCCVPGCNNRTARRYSVPSEPNRKAIWIARIGNEKIAGVEDASNFRVCADHFADICKDGTGRIKNYSLPTLNLPGYDQESNEENCFHFPKEAQLYKTPQKVKDVLKLFKFQESIPSTSKRGSPEPELKVEIPTKVYEPLTKKLKFQEPSDFAKTSSSRQSVLIKTESPLPADFHDIPESLGVSKLPQTTLHKNKNLHDGCKNHQHETKTKLAEIPEFLCTVLIDNNYYVSANLILKDNPNEKAVHIVAVQRRAHLDISFRIPVASINHYRQQNQNIILIVKEDPEPIVLQFTSQETLDAAFKAVDAFLSSN